MVGQRQGRGLMKNKLTGWIPYCIVITDERERMRRLFFNDPACNQQPGTSAQKAPGGETQHAHFLAILKISVASPFRRCRGGGMD
jgi:hypothetical protein